MEQRAKKITDISAISMIVFTVISIIAAIIYRAVVPIEEFRGIFDYLFTTIEYIIKILLAYFIFIILCNRKKIKPVEFKMKTNTIQTIAIVVWATSAIILLGGAYAIFLTGPIDIIPVSKGMNVLEHVIIIIIYVISPALLDEIMFRGLFAREYSIFGMASMFMFSSLVYGLSKFSLAEFPYLFICGLFFCFVYYFTGSLTSVIITHLVHSTVSYCLKLVQVTMLPEEYKILSGIIYIVLGVLFIGSIILLMTQMKNYKKEEKETVLSYRFFTPFMIVFLVVATAFTILWG